MNLFLGILLTISVFTIVVFIHELGHFLAARFFGMFVHEFGIGIPPRFRALFQDKKGTLFTLNWLPIGGFVRIKGESPTSLEANESDSFAKKSWFARSVVLLAGVTMNFLLTIVLFIVLFLISVKPIGPNTITKDSYGSVFFPSFRESLLSGYITSSGVELVPLTGSLAERSGVGSGDILESIDDAPVILPTDLIEAVRLEKEITLGLLAPDGSRHTVRLTPIDGKIGTQIGLKNPTINENYHLSGSLLASAGMALHETYAMSRITLEALGTTLGKLISPKNPEERKEASKNISGPIGIGDSFVEMVGIGVDMRFIIFLIAILSLNLGILNVMPFPALDGGRFVTTTLSALAGLVIRDRHILSEFEGYIHAFGMILILILSALVAWLDLFRIFF